MVSQFGTLGYTIMGKTADLTVVQKTIIDSLHKEGKPQTFIAKEDSIFRDLEKYKEMVQYIGNEYIL